MSGDSQNTIFFSLVKMRAHQIANIDVRFLQVNISCEFFSDPCNDVNAHTFGRENASERASECAHT